MRWQRLPEEQGGEIHHTTALTQRGSRGSVSRSTVLEYPLGLKPAVDLRHPEGESASESVLFLFFHDNEGGPPDDAGHLNVVSGSSTH